MKSYTDIDQSKKLAEILPLESADMSYTLDFNSGRYGISTTSYKSWIVPKYAQPNNGFGQVIPCWSLSALFDALPKIHGLKPILDLEVNSIQYCGTDIYVVANNPTNAAYEIILKLKVRNLI